MEDYRQAAADFIRNQTQFHLGFLPTEQSNPLTRRLEETFRSSTAAGVRNLQQVDRGVLAMAEKVVASPAFSELLDRGCRVVGQGGRIVFSGCGATGRLSILLEAMWREACFAHRADGLADSVQSIMTGGDYALVKSVESFEDYAVFGARQVEEMALSEADLLVAITEGGETSSVLGTVAEATKRGAGCFLLFNNPAELLAGRIARSREAIENPLVTVLDLCCGPMALAGSTRMQATTSEQLIAAGALEHIFARTVSGERLELDLAAAFRRLLDSLESAAAVEAIADYIDFELAVYRQGGRITYQADAYMLDIFTDTTERSPTFMLPPFRKIDDAASPVSWALARNPLLPTPDAIRRALGRREPRCLNWTPADYRAMGTPEIAAAPPAVSTAELEKFPVGNEPLPERCDRETDAAVLFRVGEPAPELTAAFEAAAAPFARRRELVIGPGGIELAAEPTALKVFEHLGVKLALNTISTGVMVKYGRVSGNWMNFVAVSNKKLIDRAIRLVSELGQVDYDRAALEVFKARCEIAALPEKSEKPSAVQWALKNMKGEV